MRLGLHSILVTAVVSIMAAPSVALQAIAPPPQGRWLVDFADNQCVAGRDYAASSGFNKVLIRPDIMGRTAEIVIVTPKPVGDDHFWGKLLLSANGAAPEKPEGNHYSVYGLTNGGRAIYITTDWAGLPTTGKLAVQLDFASAPDLTVDFGNWAMLKTALDKCSADLRRVKGVTDEMLSRQAIATTSLVSLISSEDYPARAVRERRGGTVKVLFWVNERGRAEKCEVLESSRSPDLDQQTCFIIQSRSRFIPAKDAQGRPVRQPNTARLKWDPPRG